MIDWCVLTIGQRLRKIIENYEFFGNVLFSLQLIRHMCNVYKLEQQLAICRPQRSCHRSLLKRFWYICTYNPLVPKQWPIPHSHLPLAHYFDCYLCMYTMCYYDKSAMPDFRLKYFRCYLNRSTCHRKWRWLITNCNYIFHMPCYCICHK